MFYGELHHFPVPVFTKNDKLRYPQVANEKANKTNEHVQTKMPISKITNFQIYKFFKFKKSSFQIPKLRTRSVHRLSIFFKILDSRIYKQYLPQRFHISYMFWRIFGIFNSINKGYPGLENPEFMEFGGSGPSHNKTIILLDKNEAE